MFSPRQMWDSNRLFATFHFLHTQHNIRDTLSFHRRRRIFYLLPVIYLLYIPAQAILKLWLPQYAESIDYLAIVLPICYFDSKMDLIGSTFFKVLNQQVNLLRINLVTIVLSGIIGILSAYIFNDMNILILGLVISIAFRSLLADYVLSHMIGIRITMLDFFDVMMAIIFIEVNQNYSWWLSLILLLVVYLLRIIWLRVSNYKMDLEK